VTDKNNKEKKQHIETLAVHAGRPVDPGTGAVVAPLHLSTTFERDADGQYPRGFCYSRTENPNRRQLEACLAALEGGTEALAFSSGLAALAALTHGLKSGDHILAPDDVYHGFRKLFDQVFDQSGLEISYVDFSSPQKVQEAVRPTTRLIWAETPSNPLLKITDLAAIADIARKAEAISVCDSTFATPILQQPFDFGIDLVVHSLTKYIAGHSDVLGGAVIVREASRFFEHVRKSQFFAGAVLSPFDCWLTLRGIETLPYRVRVQSASALQISEWLSSHPHVESVFYPGLPSHEGHTIAARQMSHFGGVLSFLVRGGKTEAMQVAGNVHTFIRATSLGGTHSLIEHRASIEGPQSTTPPNLLRLSIGLENSEDLIEDLAQSLATLS
jgi:cystathionine gamma-synthase